MGETLITSYKKEAVKQRSIKCIKENRKEQSVFTIFSFLFPLHSLIYSTMFCHPFSRQTKKNERTHKTPIHKIKPIPSLSWANCLLEVCWRFCVDMEIVYFFCAALALVSCRKPFPPSSSNVLFLL